MSRAPGGNPAIATLKRSVFSQLAPRIRAHEGPVYPLHVGDTYLEPALGAHLADQTEAVAPGIHKYASPRGRSGLIDAIVERRRTRPGEAGLQPDNVLITAGVTAGLSATVRALLAPGQTILILAPYWPLIRGMSISHGVSVRELPFYDRVFDAETAAAVLDEAVTPDVGAVYLNWPNNPSGAIPSAAVAREIAAFAKRHDLWILADEVYEELVFDGPSPSLAEFPDAQGRLIRTFSFSKAYGMAGNRVGYLTAPAEAAARIEQLTTYLVYSVSTGGQRAAEMVLRDGDAWLADTRTRYLAAGRESAQRLGLAVPRGGTFLFVDVGAHLDERGMLGFLEDCLAEGLVISPGEIFGAEYANYVRLCFTSAPPDQVRAGTEVLARKLGL